MHSTEAVDGLDQQPADVGVMSTHSFVIVLVAATVGVLAALATGITTWVKVGSAVGVSIRLIAAGAAAVVAFWAMFLLVASGLGKFVG